MITSSSIPYISKALSEPQNISEADAESIDALTKAYPYFTPARYMDAAKSHKEAPYNEALMGQMQLYSGNWLLYSDFLGNVLEGAEVEMKTTDAIKEPIKESISTSNVTEAVEPVTPAPIVDETIEQVVPVEDTETTNEAEEESSSTDDFNPANISFNTGDKAYIRKEKSKKGTKQKQRLTDSVQQSDENDEALILPVYTDDYFLHQGVNVSNKIPDDYESAEGAIEDEEDGEKSLMVVMNFAEWLNFFKTKKQAEAEEEEGQKALKTMWQKEKLAAAIEEGDDEIPENVFEMAVNSISKEDGLISESLANIHIKQGRYDKAKDMYRKLSLRNPQKKAYFARKIESLIKEQES